MLYVALFKDNNCVVTEAVRISSLILIAHVCAAVIYKRFELMLLMTLHKSVGFISCT